MNLIKGQIIQWSEPVFKGYPNSKYLGERLNTGLILKDSYGSKRGQHSFSIQITESKGVDPLPVNSIRNRLGRNLYPTAKILSQPSNLEELIQDKKARASKAMENKFITWLEEAEFEGKHWKLDKIPLPFIQENYESLFLRFPNSLSSNPNFKLPPHD